MFFAASVALLLTGADPVEARGQAGALPAPDVARLAPRLRLGIGAVALFGLGDDATHTGGVPSFGGGVGAGLDLGVVLNDRLSLLAHAEVGTTVVTVMGSGALIIEEALSEHFTAGAGVAVTGWAAGFIDGYAASFYGLTLPLRLSFAPVARASYETARRGLLIGLQVAPGFSLNPYYQRTDASPAAVAVTLSASWASW